MEKKFQKSKKLNSLTKIYTNNKVFKNILIYY